MKISFKVALIICLCSIVPTFPRFVYGQEAPGHDIQTIRNLTDAIANSEALLAKYSDNDFTPNLMFQLSELYLKRSALKFQREMLIYEEAEEKFNQGLISKEPAIPQVDFSEAIDISIRLLEKFPTIHFRDKVLYRVALCYSEEGEKEKAVEYFKWLSEETDEQELLEESYFRLGEFYFDQKDYQSTIDYYSRLLNSWDSPFFDMALYKLGWSYYNVDDFSKAISTFIYLIEDINLLQHVESNDLGKSKADLRREAVQYVAICFAEYGRPSKAKDFLLEKKDRDYAEEVLVHLATLYRERDFYEHSIETLNILLDFYPNNPAAPKFQKQIVENYELAGEKGKADLERAKLIDRYGPGSNWIRQIPEDETRQEIFAIAEEFLYTLGTEAQERAQASRDRLDYELAIGHYLSYLEKFPNFERAHKVQFYLAECYYEIEHYYKAAGAYYNLLLNHPDSEFLEIAAYNRILAYNELLKADTSTDSTDFFLFNFLGKDENSVDVIKAVNSSQAQLLQACNDFFVFQPKSPKVSEVLMNYAKILFELGQFSLAKLVYQEVINKPSQNTYLTQAYLMIAQAEFKRENYEIAESWFQELVELFPDSTEHVHKANKMIASSRFRNAELFLANGDSVRAATEFEKVANTAPDSGIAERALFEAAKQFENLDHKSKAITLYEDMLKRFPYSKLIDESLFKAGLLCEEIEAWDRAAMNYLELYRHDRFSQYASKSLFFAAKCYENMKDYDLARAYYHEYTETYLEDPDRNLEAAFKKAEIAYNQGDFQTALKDLKSVLRTYQKFVGKKLQVESYVPANAQFLIAEISFKTFQDIKLTPPLERKLKRKQAVFQKVVKAYTGAAKYKVAEWTTASSYKIGRVFEEFADALLESPRPKNLSASDLDRYNEKLWQSVLPFKEKAQQTYEANVKNATENNIRNNWVIESEKRLKALNIELGLTPVEPDRDTDSYLGPQKNG